MKKLILLFLLMLCYQGYTQTYSAYIEIENVSDFEESVDIELEFGSFRDVFFQDNNVAIPAFRYRTLIPIPDDMTETDNSIIRFEGFITSDTGGQSDCDFDINFTTTKADFWANGRSFMSCNYEFTIHPIRVVNPVEQSTLRYCDTIDFETYDNINISYFRQWQWSFSGDRDDDGAWQDFPSSVDAFSPTIRISDLVGGSFSSEELLHIRVDLSVAQGGVPLDDTYAYAFYGLETCPPDLDDPTPTNVTCFGENDGFVELDFTNADLVDGDQLRVIIIPGSESDFDFDDNELKGPVFTESIYDDVVTLGAISGSFSYETDQVLQGGDSSENYITDYFGVYQILNSDGTVTSAEIIPTFDIAQPTPVLVNIIDFSLANCIGENSVYNLSATGGYRFGGSADPSDYELRYQINGVGLFLSTPALFSIPATAETQTIRIRANYDPDGCESVDPFEFQVPAANAAIEIDDVNSSPSPPSAPGSTDGSVTVRLSEGTPNFDYILERFDDISGTYTASAENIGTAVDDYTFSGLSEGSYRVTVNPNGQTTCSDSIEFNLIASDLPVISDVVPSPPSCIGQIDGSISLNVAGGLEPYQFRWYDSAGNQIVGENTSTLENLAPGSYSFRAISSGGDFNTVGAFAIEDNIVVPEAAEIEILSVTPTSPACFDGTDGSLTLTASGAQDYDYSLNGGVNWAPLVGGFIDNLDSGFYEIILRNRSVTNCLSDPFTNVEIANPKAINVIPTITAASTNGGFEGVISLEITEGSPISPTNPYNISWTKQTDLDPTPIPFADNDLSTPYELIGLEAATYRATIVDANSCSTDPSPIGFIISEPGLLNIEPLTGTNTCNGLETGTITATVQGTGDITFEFLLNPGPSQTVLPAISTPDRTVTISNLEAGTYGLRITEEDSGNMDTTPVEDYVIITELAIIEATVATTDTSCLLPNSGSVTITGRTGGSQFTTGPNALTGYEYRINDNFNNFQPEADFSGLVAGNYIVTVRDALGCEYNAPVTIGASELPIVDDLTTVVNNASSATSLDGSITLNFTNLDTSAYTYEWSGPDITNPNTKNQTSLGDGEYRVIVTAPGNCIVPIDFTVGVNAAFSIQDFTGTDTCNGLNSGTITAVVQGTGDILFEFLLNPGIPTETVVFNVTTPNRTITAPNLAAGTYGLRITEITSTNTITTPVANYFTISELTLINAISTPTDLACNETNTGVITITGATGGSNIGFEYAIDDGFGFQTGNTFTGLAPRTYIVTVRDDLGCVFTTTTEIVQAGAPVLNDLTTVVTNASSATNLDGSIVLEFETDPTNYTYVWSGPGLTGITTKDVNLIGAGTYQVIVSAPGNCTLPIDFTVGVQSAFSIQSFTGTPTCFNQPNGSLTATIEATGLVTFNWILDDGSVNGMLVDSENTDLRTLSTEGLSPGTYYLEIENDNNQTIRSTNDVVIVQLAEVSAIITPVPTCNGEATGSITFSVPTGSPTGNYSYSIDDGVTFQPEPLFEGLANDIYIPRMRAFENPNCDFRAPGVQISDSPILNWDILNSPITRASGPGATDGAVSATFTGGTAPYTFVWTPNPTNSTTQTITGVGAGMYNLTITDASNCSITEDFEVTEVGPLSITNINPTDVLCRGEANGSITTTVTGEGTINYVWTLANGDPVPVSNGVNGPNITGIAAGDYILTATDINSTVVTSAITIGEPATALSITTITPTNISCFGGSDGAIAIQAAGGTGGYTFSINGGAFQPSPIVGLIANSYTIIVRDANDCEFTELTPVLLTAPEQLNLIINEQRPVSAANATDGAIFITAEGGSGNYTYEWTGPNGFTSTEEDILTLGAGDYNVTITDANFGINNDEGCRFISNTITIAEPGVLIATINQSVFLECSGDDFAEITANVQGGVLPYVYEWFQVANGNNTALKEDTDIIAGLSEGTYFLRVTDANSVTRDTNPVVITAPSQVVVTIDGTTNVLCTGQPTGAANITVSGGTPPYQYFWSNAATVPDVTGLDAGQYTIEVEDANGCIAQNTVTITAPDDAIQIADVTINNVSAFQALDGSISLDVIGGVAPYTYVWTRFSDNSNAGNQATISNLGADSFTVVVSDANGCAITETYEVTQPDIIDETIIQPSCTDESDGSISVLVNEGNGTFTYLWNDGSTENNINNLGAGNYSVIVTGLAEGPQTRNYVLENPVPLEVNLGLDRVLCADQVLELDGTVDDPTASYSWTSDNGFTSSNAAVVLSQTGNYTLTVQSQTGCTTEGTIFVDISTDVIDAEFAVSSQVFVGETIVAVDISFPLPDGIEWILPIGAQISTQDRDAVEFSFPEAGEYDITVITTRGECIAQKTKKVIVVAKDGLIQEDEDQSGQKLVEEFIVYPNPTSGKFTADINLTEPGDVSVKIFSFANNALMASEKERGETSYSIPFDISGMPSGVYAVLLETPFGTSLRKIVVL